MAKEPIFYLKNGDLTLYALACGYVQKKVRKEGTEVSVQLYQEHNTFHVQKITYPAGSNLPVRPIHWETFDNITEARKHYRKLDLSPQTI